ncbi:hypothetical protein ACOSP7_017088 [Xanthoceras sorbifolium]
MARALLHCSTTSLIACATATETETGYSSIKLPPKTRNSRVLILGGSGRVGGSTAIAHSNLSPEIQILVGCRNREKGAAVVNKLGKNSEIAEVNIDNMDSLETALKDVDLVVHAAGPFQQTQKCTVLEAAIETKTAYLDVCDDTSYAFRAKSLKNKAIAANIPAITTGGIYPGVSNVMAVELVRAARSESKGEPERLRFSYYTAGTGGAGPTILATRVKIKLKPYSGMLSVDFGEGIKRKDVFLLNLPEVRSTHEVLGVPSVSARFGTAPFFWNWGMAAMTRLLPAEYLRDRSKVQAVDGIAGERVSMRVDLECSDGRNTVGIFTHRKLSVSVGNATAAFALAVLEGSTQPGVWFPEEPEGIAVEARELLLEHATRGTANFVMNKPPWMVETVPKEVGLGIYV